jgi:pyridoxal phosphate enzyme (YggS family)
MSAIAARLADVRARIAEAAAACGRRPEDVKLVAVSKKHPPEAILEAMAAGQRAFGENYAQELDAKASALAGKDVEWHFIGHLQTNKAKMVARCAQWVHAVDNAAVARELGKRTAREGRGPLPVLIEVSVGGESQKHGASPSELGEVIGAVAGEAGLVLRGLMTMPPAGDLEGARRVFETLRTLRSLHGGEARLPELSMGMSDDLEVAIACGATLVRVGTAIFGARE